MKNLLIALLLSSVLISCNTKENDFSSLLNDVNAFMEEHPDSALNVLQSVNVANLQNKRQKALYSLLYSMALDKNFIDKTDFSVLQPAIDYYLKKGNATEKLRTYYYMGRIYDNLNNDEQAMKCFVQGMKFGENSDDCLTFGRLLFSKALIHNKIFEYDKFIEYMFKASSNFKEAKKQSSYFNALSLVIRGYTIVKDTTILDKKILSNLWDILDKNNESQKSSFYDTKIHYENTFGNIGSIRSTINECISDLSPSKRPWFKIAEGYYIIGNYNKCKEALSMYRLYNNYQNAGYYAIASKLYEKIGNPVLALENYKMYIKLSDSADMAIFKRDTKFIEERHSMELQQIREKNNRIIIVLVSITLIFLISLLVVWLRYKLKIKTMKNISLEQEKENYKILCSNLSDEKHTLVMLLEKSQNLGAEIKEVIEERLSVVNKFFKAHLLDDHFMASKTEKELENMFNDKAKFIKDTKLVLQGNYPDFIKYLQERGLTDKEIDFCCLYTMGLKAVHIGKYLNTTNIYNISSSIRKKLGIDEYKTNLDKHIEEIKDRTAAL